jgi:hypothetical protein
MVLYLSGGRRSILELMRSLLEAELTGKWFASMRTIGVADTSITDQEDATGWRIMPMGLKKAV